MYAPTSDKNVVCICPSESASLRRETMEMAKWQTLREFRWKHSWMSDSITNASLSLSQCVSSCVCLCPQIKIIPKIQRTKTKIVLRWHTNPCRNFSIVNQCWKHRNFSNDYISTRNEVEPQFVSNVCALCSERVCSEARNRFGHFSNLFPRQS